MSGLSPRSLSAPLLSLLASLCLASPPEFRLLNDLFEEYVKEERPVLNHKEPVQVTLGVILQQIIDVDEREEQLCVNAWLKFNWRDENLRWNPEFYENVTDLRHPAGSIWQPDILLYNSVDAAFDSTYKVNLLGYSDGSVTWMPPGIFKVSCQLDIYWFPFDEQTCFFKFGSWSFSGDMIDLQVGEFDFSEYMPNGEWHVQDYWANKTVKYYDCCPDQPYTDIKFFLRLRRRTLYYAFNLIMPCLLTMVLVVAAFTLSSEAGEKIGFQISLTLAICFFVAFVNDITPVTSDAVPLLGIFFQSCNVIATLATSFTVYVQGYHFRNHQCSGRMGFWMRYLLLEWGPWLLRMEMPKRVNNLSTIRRSWAERKKERDEDAKTAFDYGGTGMALAAIGSAMKDNFEGLVFQVKMSKTPHDRQVLDRLKVLDKIYTHVKMMREHDDDGEEDRHVAFEWRFAAIVVDRLCMISFALIVTFTSAIIAFRAPYLFA